MKKLSLVLMCIFLGSYSFASLARQNDSRYFNINLSTSTSYTVSSYTVTALSDMARDGLVREFAILGTCDGTVFYQKGGSTTTVASVGIPMKESAELYIVDNYFGDIYFATDTSTATLRVTEITK